MDTQTIDLVTKYHNENRLDLILTLCDALKSQRDRAEAKVDALTHINAKLAASFANITEPATGRKITDKVDKPAVEAARSAASGAQGTQKPAQKPPSSKSGFDTSTLEF